MCSQSVARAVCQCESAWLPGTTFFCFFYPIRQFCLTETPILVWSHLLPKLFHPPMKNTDTGLCARISPARHKALEVHRYTYLETITRKRAMQCSHFFFPPPLSATVPYLSVLFIFPPKTKLRSEWACLTLFLKQFFKDIKITGCPWIGDAWGEKCGPDYLCVALLDMMRDDIMVDAPAAALVRWARMAICLTFA